jgi:hypothetical protein
MECSCVHSTIVTIPNNTCLLFIRYFVVFSIILWILSIDWLLLANDFASNPFEQASLVASYLDASKYCVNPLKQHFQLTRWEHKWIKQESTDLYREPGKKISFALPSQLYLVHFSREPAMYQVVRWVHWCKDGMVLVEASRWCTAEHCVCKMRKWKWRWRTLKKFGGVSTTETAEQGADSEQKLTVKEMREELWWWLVTERMVMPLSSVHNP